MTLAVYGVEIIMILIVADLLLGWVQEDPRMWPRRLSHWLTEPLLIPVRAVVRRLPTGGWDVSPVVLLVCLTLLKVGVLQ